MFPISDPIKLVIHWPRFGPYHLARLQETHTYCQNKGCQLVGLEMAGRDNTYAWRGGGKAILFNA